MTKELPIIFTGESVRAILEGCKTQTRRVIRDTGLYAVDADIRGTIVAQRERARLATRCPYGIPGDRLWVKENWAQRLDRDHLNGTQLYAQGVREAWYWADGPGRCCNTGCNGAAGRVRVARFMPRWASRITLQIVDVRVEQVQEISAADAIAEGIERIDPRQSGATTIMRYARLWDAINAKRGYSWEAKPWVWVITFRPVPRGEQ